MADVLIKKRLAACANIIDGIDSIFWWNGKIDKAREALAIFKTSAAKFRAIEKEVLRIHSYDVPEIIALPIISGSDNYLKWIRNSLK